MLEEYDVHGAPVVDNDGSLIGMITRSDVVGFLTDHVEHEIAGGMFDTTRFRATEVERLLDSRTPNVEEGMAKGVVSIEPDATAGEVAELMHSEGIGRVVVTDQDKVVGVVSTTDLLDVVGRYESALNGTIGPHPGDL